MFIVVPLLVFMVNSALGAVDYCGKDYYCVTKGATRQHSMCVENKNAQCVNVENVLSDDQLEKQILRFHNDLRASMSSKYSPFDLPTACPIRPLDWDPELALFAKHWATNCSAETDPCRKKKEQGRDIPIGQNMALIVWTDESPKTPLASILGYWWNMMGTLKKVEREKFAVHYKKGIWDSGAQMIWADSRTIGCAHVNFKGKSGHGFIASLVCNYGPKGNNPGKEMYKGCQYTRTGKSFDVDQPYIPPSNDQEVIIFDSNGKSVFPLKFKDTISETRRESHQQNSLGTELNVPLIMYIPVLLLEIQLVAWLTT